MKAFAIALIAGVTSALENWGLNPYALPKSDWGPPADPPKFHPRSSRAKQAQAKLDGWNKQIQDPWAKSKNNPWNAEKALG